MSIRQGLSRARRVAARYKPRGRPAEGAVTALVERMDGLASRYPFWTPPAIQGATWRSLDARGASAGIRRLPDGWGKNNWLVVCVGARRTSSLTVRVDQGVSGAICIIGPGADFTGDIQIQGDDCLVSLGGRTPWQCVFEARLSSGGNAFLWGDGSTSNGLRAMIEGEGCAAVVGDDCMFARDIHLATSDLHGIGDAATGRWINPPKDVVIDRHVWVGQGALILKGAEIGAGTIVGARAVVTGSVEAGALALGAPARIARRGVAWVRERKYDAPRRIEALET